MRELEDVVRDLAERLEALEGQVQELRAEAGPPMPLLERQYRARRRALEEEEGT